MSTKLPRFYYEQDGDARKGSVANAHYVVDKYADPLSDRKRVDVTAIKGQRSLAAKAKQLAAEWNELPPWEPWDTIQAERDGYVSPAPKPEGH